MAEAYNLTAAKWWYAITFSASAVVYPFLTIYFKLCGFTDAQVGILFAVRPWLTALMGNVWAGIADHLEIHWPLFIICYVLSSLSRFSICLTSSFPVALGICVLTEMFAPPVMILMDAATMAASAQAEGGYGRIRMWGAIGWGGMSPLGGWLVTSYGMRNGFYGYLLMVTIGLVPAVLAPIQVLTHRCKDAKQARLVRQSAARQPAPAEVQGGVAGKITRHIIAHPDGLQKQSTAGQLLLTADGTDAESTAELSEAESDYATAAGSSPASEYTLAESALINSHILEGSASSSDVVRASPSMPSVSGNDHSAAAQAHRAASALGADGLDQAAHLPQQLCLRQQIDDRPGAPQHASASHGPGPHRSQPAGVAGREAIDAHAALMWAALEQLPLTFEPVLQAYNPQALQASHTPSRPDSFDMGSQRKLHLPVRVSEPPQEPAILFADHTAADNLTSLQRVLAVVSRGEVAVFLVTAVMMGYGMGTIDSFMFIYLSELGGTEFLMGLCIATMCAAEAPIFHFAGRILDAVGLPLTLHIVIFVYVLRLCLYGCLSLAGTPWAVLPIELLHGITFGCAWAAGTLNCSRIAPKGLEATTQALFNGLYTGVGLGLGACVGGFIYDAFNARVVFFAAAAVVATGWALVSSVQLLMRCSDRRHSGSKPGSDSEAGLQDALLQRA